MSSQVLIEESSDPTIFLKLVLMLETSEQTFFSSWKRKRKTWACGWSMGCILL